MFLGDEDEPEAGDLLASERAAFKAEGEEIAGGVISAETPVKGIICNMTGLHRYASNKPNSLSFHLVLTHEVYEQRERDRKKEREKEKKKEREREWERERERERERESDSFGMSVNFLFFLFLSFSPLVLHLLREKKMNSVSMTILLFLLLLSPPPMIPLILQKLCWWPIFVHKSNFLFKKLSAENRMVFSMFR